MTPSNKGKKQQKSGPKTAKIYTQNLTRKKLFFALFFDPKSEGSI
jgi:hypothetical protein